MTDPLHLLLLGFRCGLAADSLERLLFALGVRRPSEVPDWPVGIERDHLVQHRHLRWTLTAAEAVRLRSCPSAAAMAATVGPAVDAGRRIRPIYL